MSAKRNDDERVVKQYSAIDDTVKAIVRDARLLHSAGLYPRLKFTAHENGEPYAVEIVVDA